MVNIKYVNKEEVEQMDKHKWVESEKHGHDIGPDAYLNWIELYAKPFREWSNTIPENCISCGLKDCSNTPGNECTHPFNEHRIRVFITRKTTILRVGKP